MRNDRFFKNSLLPYAEIRHSRGSTVPFKSHLHKTLSIGAVEQGEVYYSVQGEEAPLTQGSLAVVNPETLHACNPVSGMERSFYMLYLDAAWCLQIQQSLWKVDTLVAFDVIKLDSEFLYKKYCQAMELMLDPDTHLQEKEQCLYDLLTEIFSAACSPQKESEEITEHVHILKQLLGADLQKDLPIKLLAQEIDVNAYTLIRSFKAVTGITPHAYRMNCRIEKAKALLREGWDIAETAIECGFFDQSHLHRHFKAMTTVTPRAYRVNFIQ